MERNNRRNRQAKYRLSEIRFGAKDIQGSEELFCPHCDFVLATVIYGIAGFNAYRQSNLLGGEYMGGNCQMLASGGIAGGGFDSNEKSWRFCIQLPQGFVHKGEIRNDSYAGMKQFMYEEEFRLKPTRTTMHHIKRVISNAESLPVDERSIHIRRLVDSNPNHYDLIIGWANSSVTIPYIYESATRLGLSIGPMPEIANREERRNQAIKDVKRRFKQVKTTLLEPDLPIAVICPKCSHEKAGQMIMVGAIMLITS